MKGHGVVKEHVSRAWGVIYCDFGSGFIGQTVKRGQKGGLFP